MNPSISPPSLQWSTQLDVLPLTSTPPLRGDKIILPPSALEQLLSAATIVVPSTAQPQNSTFDPYNPYSYAAERQAREQLVERQQRLPHPLTFRLVNPENGRIIFAGIREFSAIDGAVGLSPYLRQALGVDQESQTDTTLSYQEKSKAPPQSFQKGVSRLTVHTQDLPKGTFVKLRPLEAGYDPEDWKALLEQHLRDTFTTLTNGEIITIPAGKEIFRFLVDGLKPGEDAISLVDTDLEVDIEPLNEEQARETLQKLIQKSQRSPGTKDGSSAGGRTQLGSNETGQVRPGDYVDYSIEKWNTGHDLEFELTSLDNARDVDLFISPFGRQQRSRPREDAFIFADVSSQLAKRIRIARSNVQLEHAEALWISVRGYKDSTEMGAKLDAPIHYNLHMSSTNVPHSNHDVTSSDTQPPDPDEDRCSNCQQYIPKRTIFLHQNFCFRNNILCPICNNVFQKTSAEWRDHWHCPHDSAYGDSQPSKIKHDDMMHTSRMCALCDYEAANVSDLAHHRTTVCPGKLILCQFCHLQVPQQGPDDSSFDSAEVILSGLTPHELSDGARTTECHLCSKIIRLRDMSTHLKHHDLQRSSRTMPRICNNTNCGRTLDGVSRVGEVRHQASKNDLNLCETCFGPLYVSQYDPDGKALRRRVERKYLTQLLTGCNQPWCRNDFCKTGRINSAREGAGQSVTSKDAMSMIKPFLEKLQDDSTAMYFCTDEASSQRRLMAEMIAVAAADLDENIKGTIEEKRTDGYALEWCIAALEVEGGDLEKARMWLKNFAPTRAEAAR